MGGTTEQQRLETFLSWRLAVAGRLVRSSADAHDGLQAAGAQGTGILMRLLEHDGLTQIGLARLQRVEAPTLCRMVDRLERDGLVERRAHPGDRRASCVFLTPAGRRAANRGRRAVADLEEVVFGALDTEERARLADLLDRVLERLPGEPPR